MKKNVNSKVGATNQTHEFSGVIRKIHDKDPNGNPARLYEMEVKGRLDATPESPAIVEVMTPDDQFKAQIQNFISTKDGATIPTVHPGQAWNVLIELPKEVPIGSILRRELKN